MAARNAYTVTGFIMNNSLGAFLSTIVDDAIDEILEHEDPQKFLHWFEQQVANHCGQQEDLFKTPQEARSLANSMGRALWNAVPLPGNNFRPRPLLAPQRNDACPCGSGNKYKRCCGGGSPAPALDSQALWPLVLQHLSQPDRVEAIERGRIPMGVLIAAANENQEAGRPKIALGFLEPVFEHGFRRTDEDHDYALNLLCNIYDNLGHTRKKKTLLARVTKEAKRSPLRSGAWQRLAAIRMDDGDSAGAWDSFQTAQRDDPGSLSLGQLEVQLLIAEGKPALASERARYWVKRLQRQGWSHDEGPLEFLNAVAQDAALAMAQVGIDIAGGAGQRLLAWLDEVASREVPDYTVTRDPPGGLPEPGEDWRPELAKTLADMGIPAQEIPAAIADLPIPDHPATVAPGDTDAESQESRFLTPPASVLALEDAWRPIFPVGKPFSIGMAGGGDQVWDASVEDAWMHFLESAPAAFDSLDILDDLATAVFGHEQWNLPGLDEKLLQPILRRSKAIIEHALLNTDNVQLFWGHTENRPALRCLVHLVYAEEQRGNDDAAAELAELVLSLNPHDNHGLRTLVINALLRRGDDEKAVHLADQYPGDMNPDIAYGKALGLYRLGDRQNAQAALAEAVAALPRIPRFLTAKRIRKPKMEALGVLIGGADQAWIYRQDMQDIWLATPGAVAWLKSAIR